MSVSTSHQLEDQYPLNTTCVTDRVGIIDIQAYDRFTSCLAQALKWQAADLLSEAVDFWVSQKVMVGDMATDFSLVKWFSDHLETCWLHGR